MESDFLSSRLEQPIRPATPIVTSTRTTPTKGWTNNARDKRPTTTTKAVPKTTTERTTTRKHNSCSPSRGSLHVNRYEVCAGKPWKHCFCSMRTFRQTGRGPRPMHSGRQGKAELCFRRADRTSDDSLCHCFGTLKGVFFETHHTLFLNW